MTEKSGPIESYGNFATGFTKARIFHLIYLFKLELSPPYTDLLLPFCHLFLLRNISAVSHGADAVYLLLFLACLSVLSDRCASLPHHKWPFNELVKDLNYPRTWEKHCKFKTLLGN